MKQRKIPMRKCIGCNAVKPKKELVRIVKSPVGEISVDLTGKKSGRGAYICKDISCLESAKKAKRFEKTFECNIPEDVYKKLAGEIPV